MLYKLNILFCKLQNNLYVFLINFMGQGKRLTYYVEKQCFTKKNFCEKFGFNYNNMVNVFADKREIGMILLNQLQN